MKSVCNEDYLPKGGGGGGGAVIAFKSTPAWGSEITQTHTGFHPSMLESQTCLEEESAELEAPRLPPLRPGRLEPERCFQRTQICGKVDFSQTHSYKLRKKREHQLRHRHRCSCAFDQSRKQNKKKNEKYVHKCYQSTVVVFKVDLKKYICI